MAALIPHLAYQPDGLIDEELSALRAYNELVGTVPSAFHGLLCRQVAALLARCLDYEGQHCRAPGFHSDAVINEQLKGIGCDCDISETYHVEFYGSNSVCVVERHGFGFVSGHVHLDYSMFEGQSALNLLLSKG